MASLKKCSVVFICIASAIAVFAVFLQFRGRTMTCVFCDVVDKKTSTDLIYEDDVSYATLASVSFLNIF